MPRFNFNIRQIISAVLSLLTILGIIIGGISSGSSIPAAPPAATSSASQQAVLDATNDFRAQNGLAPVKANAALNDLAQDWAETIARTGEFKHRANYWEHYPANMRPGGENIAQGNRGDSGRVFVNRWANSPGHRKNMLDPEAKSLGVGVAQAADGRLYVVQNFGHD